MGIKISSLYLYRLRYWIGYGLIGVTSIALLIFAGLYIPGGLSENEIKSTVVSSSLTSSDLSSFSVTNLPYHLLQNLSFKIFGVTNLSIKLPTIMVSLATALGLVLLLRLWYKKNVAVVGAAIALTTGQFLYIGQSGDPNIMNIFWPVVVLLLGTLVAKLHSKHFIWKILLFVAIAWSLYTPFSVYAIAALTIAALLHPHLRYIFKKLSKKKLVLAGLIGLFFLIPFFYATVVSSDFRAEILGIQPSLPDFAKNLSILSGQYLGFNSSSSILPMVPVFGLGSALIILFGFYKLIKNRATSQSYLIILWIVSLIPIIIFNTDSISMTFLPLVLVLCSGIDGIIRYWYNLFPSNPYARITGLIPLSILVIALTLPGLQRYIDGYRYDPQAVGNFSYDLKLMPSGTKDLVVSDGEIPFYKSVQKYNPDISVGTEPTGSSFTATVAAKKDFKDYKIESITTSRSANDGARFYTYKKIDK